MSDKEKEFTGWRKFWNKQSPDLSGVMLNQEAMLLEAGDRLQILDILPSWEGKRVLELGAGIGRFTGAIAQRAKQITAVDFSKAFIEENKERNAEHNNIDYICDDVMNLEFREGQFDIIFSNWLLMYIEDAKAQKLTKSFAQWLTPKGHLFFRESCLTGSRGQKPSKDNPAHYRNPKFYENSLSSDFRILERGNVTVYEDRYGNPNQLFWLAHRK